MTLVVDGGPVWILEIKPLEFNYLFYGTVQLEESVGDGSAELVGDERFGCVVGCHIVAVHGHDAGRVSADGRTALGEHDADGSVGGDDLVVIGRFVDCVDQIPAAGTKDQ